MRIFYVPVFLLITVCGVYAQNTVTPPPLSECPWQCQIPDGDKTYLYATCYQPQHDSNNQLCTSSYIDMTKCTSNITVDSEWGYLVCEGTTAGDANPPDGQCEEPSECVSNNNAVRFNGTPNKSPQKKYKPSK